MNEKTSWISDFVARAKGTMVPTFKLRAETIADVAPLLRRIHAQRVVIVAAPGLPDVTVTIEGAARGGRPLDLAGLRAILLCIEDGQVMAETLAPASQFAGLRVQQMSGA